MKYSLKNKYLLLIRFKNNKVNINHNLHKLISYWLNLKNKNMIVVAIRY